MATMMKHRIEALEGGPSHGLKPWQDPNWKPWHRIIVDAEQTEDEAIAAYEAENGPIGDDESFIVRIMV